MLPAALVLSLLAFSGPHSGPDATVVGHGGRVELVGGDGRVWIVNEDEARSTRGEAHLAVGAGSRVEVAWPGIASARFDGPTVVEWRNARDTLVPDGVTRSIALQLLELGSAEIEVRAPRAEFVLPGGWRVVGERVAFALHAAGGTSVRVESRAGHALVIDGPRDAVPPRPRVVLAAGDAIELDVHRPAPRRIERGPEAEPWTEVVWPWGTDAPVSRAVSVTMHAPIDELEARASTELALVIETRIGPVHVDVEGPSTPVVPVPTAGLESITRPTAPELAIATEDARPPEPSEPLVPVLPPIATERRAVGAPKADEPPPSREAELPPTPAEPATEAPASNVRDETPPSVEAATALPPPVAPVAAPRAPSVHRALDWRGLAHDRLEPFGVWGIERVSGLELDAHGERITVALAADAPFPAWCLGGDRDLRVFPGTRCELGRSGRVLALDDAVEAHFSLSGRPGFDAVVAPAPPVVEVAVVPETTVAPEPSAPHDARLLRGLSADRLERHGLWSFERSDALVIGTSDTGRLSVRLDKRAAGPVWCLGPTVDVHLQPGATLLIDARGVLGGHQGSIRVHPAPPERPKLTLDR